MVELEKEKTKANFQTETIKGLVILFYKNLLMPSPRQYSVAHSLCRTLAKRFDQKKYVEELDRMYKKTGIGYPLGLIQAIAYRDLMHGSRINKTYNYGFRTKPIKLGDMVTCLDNCMQRIIDIFTDICVTNDIDTTLTMPMIEGISQDTRGL